MNVLVMFADQNVTNVVQMCGCAHVTLSTPQAPPQSAAHTQAADLNTSVEEE